MREDGRTDGRTDRQTDRQTGRRTDGPTKLTKLIIDFRNFANAPRADFVFVIKR